MMKMMITYHIGDADSRRKRQKTFQLFHKKWSCESEFLYYAEKK